MASLVRSFRQFFSPLENMIVREIMFPAAEASASWRCDNITFFSSPKRGFSVGL